MIGWIAYDLPLVATSFARLPIRIPLLTETVLRISRPAIDHLALSFTCLAGFLALDCWIHWRLSRSSSSGVIRELWSGLVILVPVLFLCVATMATTFPYVKLVEALTRTHAANDQAVRDEQEALRGSWKLIAGEVAGRTLAEKELAGQMLTFTDNRFSWDAGQSARKGIFDLGVHRRPKALDLGDSAGPYQGRFQTGIYALDGNRLRICLAPISARNEDIPIDFSTKGTRCTLYTFERVNLDAGK
jgi:uncharacterized protein (TIGR03067 family)